MAAHLLRLRLALLSAGMRGSARRRAQHLGGFMVLAVAVAVGCTGLLALRTASTDAAFVVTVLGGSALTLGFVAAPLVVGAVDPLDPRGFRVLDTPARPLAALLAVVGLVSVPAAALTALAVCTVVLWAAHGVPWPAGVLGAVLGVVVCSLLARVGMALTALFLRERRSRELAGLFVMGILVVVVPVGAFLASLQWSHAVPDQLATAADILADTPLGAAWSIPARWGTAQSALSTVVALVTIGLLALAWDALVRRSLRLERPPAPVHGSGGLGWFAIAPATPGGAVAARSMLYWFTDRRYLVNLLAVPVAAALAMVPLLIVGVPLQIVILVPVPIMALFLGWLPHNDLAYDSTAVWMHIAGGVRGISDRVGRLAPVLVLGVPVLAIGTALVIAIHDRWAMLPAMAGVCTSLFLGGLGLSSISSALAPYPVTHPGDSPFRQPERSGAAGAIAQAAVLLGAVAVSTPSLWWGWLAMTRDPRYASTALWVGVGVGVGVLAAGLAVGAAVFERRGQRIVEFAESA